MLDLTWAGERLTLRGDRALFWPRHRALLIADPHFGKAAAFRAAGIPVPRGTTRATIGRLDTALEGSAADTLLVLGDLFHARTSLEQAVLDQLRRWRHARPELRVLLVRGNHDRHAGDPPDDLGIECVDGPHELPPFNLVHEPVGGTSELLVAGHIHPVVRVVDRDGFRARLPCFHLTARTLILPAFGDFTGTHVIRPGQDERVFAICSADEVIDVTSLAGRGRRRS